MLPLRSRDVGVWRGSYPDFGGLVALGPGFRPHNPGWIRNQHLWIKTPKMSEFKRCDFRFIFYLGNIIPRESRPRETCNHQAAVLQAAARRRRRRWPAVARQAVARKPARPGAACNHHAAVCQAAAARRRRRRPAAARQAVARRPARRRRRRRQVARALSHRPAAERLRTGPGTQKEKPQPHTCRARQVCQRRG